MSFKNEPPLDFTIETNRVALADALAGLDAALQKGPIVVKPIINGKEVCGSEVVKRYDPALNSKLICDTHYATPEQAAEALTTLNAGASAWEHTPVRDRCATLRKMAQLMRQRRAYITALIIREGGKPWKEADADICEAIDFCDYYADEMEKLGHPRLTMDVPGEDSYYFYQPRGIVSVISPWNFPLAIACGMTVASLVAGNVTVLKPSGQTTAIGAELAKIILESGVPGSAFAYLPGRGSLLGRALVDSPLIDMICFTGSREVGLEIIQRAAVVHSGQRSIKRVIAELGGKNAIIVDEDADLDEAIKGVIYSAFGYAGQKCSACSRLIAVGSAYEPLMERLSQAAKDLLVGVPSDPSTFLGPVIDGASRDRILATIADGEKGLKLAFKGNVPSGGYYVPATIFKDVPVSSALWQEEIFGPVLCCTKANSFEEAISMANNSAYALTGGVYSRSPSNLDRARSHFKVGNLYLNRGCTGAIVKRHPFGGFKMSGVGSKAGGPDYLLQFMEPRVATENTMRRGFTPTSK